MATASLAHASTAASASSREATPPPFVAGSAALRLLWGAMVASASLVPPGWRVLYDYAWFVGFGVAFAVYAVLMRGAPVVDLSQVAEAPMAE